MMREWKIRRGDDEFTAPDTKTLRDWASSGNISPTDYVHNPTLERWTFASEVPELASAFAATPQPKNRQVSRASCGVSVVMLLLTVLCVTVVDGSTGMLLFFSAAALAFAAGAGIAYVAGR